MPSRGLNAMLRWVGGEERSEAKRSEAKRSDGQRVGKAVSCSRGRNGEEHAAGGAKRSNDCRW